MNARPASAIALNAASPEASFVQSYPLVVADGEVLGAVTLRDFGTSGMAVHLRSLLGLLRLRMPEAEFLRLDGAAAADRYVTFEELRMAGIDAQFDARGTRLALFTR